MYISISDFTWFDSEDAVFISLPLKGIPARNCDVFISSRYIKLTFKPYLFECLLWKEIDVEQSKVTFDSCVSAHFNLKKIIQSRWDRLEGDEKKNKNELMKIKQQAIAEVQKYQTEKSKKYREQKRVGEKASLQAMMKIESDERKRFEDIKKETTYSAMRDLIAFQEEKNQKSPKIALSAPTGEYSQNLSFSSSSFSANSSYLNNHKSKLNLPIRKNNKIAVSFTPRVFPTPERESTKEDEEQWLKKQAEYRQVLKSKFTENDDQSYAERDPLWLQKKAISLFTAGDSEAAAFTLTEAIKLAPKIPSLYLNRSACHIQRRNFFRALEDASMALELLTPPVAQNLKSRVKAHVRRGVAFCNLQMIKEGLEEYEAAGRLDPNDASIQGDILKLKEYMDKPNNSESLNE